MAWDNVPFMIGGGVQHSVELARLVAHVAGGGDEGIVAGTDLEVTAQDVPNGTVKIFPGACLIKDRSPVGAFQSYAARMPTITNLAIAATGASPRNDLIIARIENPYYSGSPWADPGTDPAARQAYQYIKAVPVSGVAATAKTVTELGLGYSAIPLALVQMPANTSVVYPEYITDLRQMVRQRNEILSRVIKPTATETLTSTGFTNWPDEARMDVFIPEWATHMNVRAILGGIRYGEPGDNGGAGWNATGNLRIQIGDDVFSASTAYNVGNEGGKDRGVLLTGESDIEIDPLLRGEVVMVRVEGKKDSGSTSLTSDTGSAIAMDVTLLAKPETNL